MLVLSAMRVYRSLESPVKVDLSSIELPPKEGSKEEVEKLELEIVKYWGVVGRGLSFKDININDPKYDHSCNFTPGLLKIQGWIASGSIGKGLWRILLEIAVMAKDTKSVTTLDTFINEFRASLGFGPRHGITTVSQLLT